jgi:Icc-related predicted phosphoesterase
VLKIFAFTDFHGNQEAFQKAQKRINKERPDLVLVAGDVTNYDAERAKKLLSELAEGGSPIYFVPGNMDNPELKNWKGDEHVRGLHGRCEYAANVALVGLGGSPHGVFSTPFELSEQEAAELLERAFRDYHGGSLILVSHCPPRDTKIDKTFSGEHIGSTSVRKFVEKNQPVVVVSGHAHEAQGTDVIGSSVLVNTGPAKEGKCAQINLDRKVEVTFLTLG